MNARIKIQVDPLTKPPPHALSRVDIEAIFAVIPEEWRGNIHVDIVHLSATLPEHSRFERPVILGGYTFRLNVCSRGLAREEAFREVLRELAIHGLGVSTRMTHRLSRQEMQQVDRVIAPLVERLTADPDGKAA